MKLVPFLSPAGGSGREKFVIWPSRLRRWRSAWLLVVALASLGTVLKLSLAQSTPDIQSITLSPTPLLAVSQGEKPTMVLALSVEYPTVGAQYVPPATDNSGPPLIDDRYSSSTEYLGYYDSESCYSYVDKPTEVPSAGKTLADYKRFDRVGVATARQCEDAFSGNFLNFSTSSAMDMMRMALTGGDRYIDEANLTILQRAVLPDGTDSGISCFFNGQNFPAKKLSPGTDGKYLGAIPKAMRDKTGGKSVFVGNVLNQIYFGALDAPTSPNWCGGASQYTLTGGSLPMSSGSNGPGPATLMPAGTPLPGDAVFCGSDGGSCELTGNSVSGLVYDIWFGNTSDNSWSVLTAKDYSSCSSSVFGPVTGSGAKSCYRRVPAKGAGAWPPPPLPGLNSDGYFFARVKVCDSDSSGKLLDDRDYKLCQKYPSGKYKPTGAIQKYANDLRLAAFGYLIDQNAPWWNPQGAFGGVLRVPMKYVGAKTFDEAGNELGPVNSEKEWDLTTGVFYTNPSPSGHSMANSGIVNYVNKFGRMGVQGQYKHFDPVGELHYEVVRYLQGRDAATPDAVKGLNDQKRDGFPVFTTWEDPYGGSRSSTADYSCLKSSIVTIGDRKTNDPDQDRFPAPNTTDAIPDIIGPSGWRSVANSFETNGGMQYTDGQGAPRNANRKVDASNPLNPGMEFAPLIGSAYWAHSHDIRPENWSQATKRRKGLRVRSYFFDVNEWGESAGDSKANFRRMNNKLFTAAKYGGYDTDPLSEASNRYGNPFKRQNDMDDNNVWQKKDQPGEAKTYYLASSAREVLRSFDDIFQQASTAARSIAGAAVSSSSLTSAGTTVYQGSFDTQDWSGDVLSFPVTLDSNNNVVVGTTPNWRAANQLNAMSNPVGDRRIVVGLPGGASQPTASTFTWAALGSTTAGSTLQTQLSKESPTSAPDTSGADRLNYLRGDRTKEGTQFRKRASLLGDVINSGVTFLGTPTTALSDEPGYTTFYSGHTSRSPSVFVGANDGMLHALNATTGDELFAFIPSWLVPKLPALASPTYQKQAYEDATPVVGEADADGWKTVLVSGTGGGGRGVFALDVTNPSTFSAGNVMWEFTHRDDADMGFVIGKPQIVKMRISAPNESPTYKWFALVASGVNNYVADNGIFSTTGKPALFLLSLDKKAGVAWTEGTNFYKISFPADSSVSPKPPTGMVNFKPVFGGAHQVTAIYAGDFYGNMWKLDFAKHGVDEWNMASLSAFNNGSPVPLYIAKNASGVRQPISMAPAVATGPIVQGKQTVRVAFGTGKYIESDDRTSTFQNSFYVVNDPGSNTLDSSPADSAISGRARLRLGTANATTGVIAVPSFVWGQPLKDDDEVRAGFYFDFSQSGERQISSAAIRGDQLLFGSLNPTSAGSNQPCGPGRGGNEYSVNMDTGNGAFIASSVGVLGEPILLDITTRTSYTTSTSTGRRIKSVVTKNLQQGSGGLAPGKETTVKIVAGRLSWRQINNF